MHTNLAQPSPGLKRLQTLGLRLAPADIPAVPWGRWQVVDRVNGCYHVSRESASGAKTEALTNAVGRTKIFRSRLLAEQACAHHNFKATAQALSAEPLLANGGAR
jgi:hypothetical protein